MTSIRTWLIVVAMCSAATAAAAQDSSRRGKWGSRSMSAEEIPERMARLDGVLRQVDANGNGMVDPDEAKAEQWRFMERMLSFAGIERKYPMSIAELKRSMESHYRARVSGGESGARPSGGGGPPSSSGFGPPSKSLAPGFGEAAPPRTTGGFGEAKTPPSGSPPSWPPRVSGGPVESKPAISSPAAAPKTEKEASVSPAGAEAASPAGSSPPSVARRSSRFLTPAERLPKGLPEWFRRRDADGDGQVMMSEFTAQWSAEKAAEFDRYDLNRDGAITAEECLKVEKAGR